MALPVVSKIFDTGLYVADTDLSKITITDVAPSVAENVAGYYYCGQSMYYIEDRGEYFTIFVYIFDNFKPYNADRDDFFTSFDTPRVGNTIRIFNVRYTYDAARQEFVADLTDPLSVYDLGATNFLTPIIKKWQGPTDIFWRYNLSLRNTNTMFNTLEKTFEFLYHDYVAGRMSSFADSCPADPLLGVNPFGMDYSTYKRSKAARTRYQYDGLYKTLTTTGILRKYNLSKLVYWPKSTAGLAPATVIALRGNIFQQRDQFIGIYPIVPANPNVPDDYPRLCPGERVLIKGSGTRLDNNDNVVLSLNGYNVGDGQTAGPGFTNTSFLGQTSYYGIVLSMVIDGSNNIIVYQLPGDPAPTPIALPIGQYYIYQLLNYINQVAPSLYARFYVTPRPTPSFTRAESLALSNQPYLLINAPPGTRLYSPTSGTPSTFLGPNGIDVGYLFPGATLVSDANEVLLTMANSPLRLRTHTPLTIAETEVMVANLANITVESFHGPVNNVMNYDNYMACVNELSMASSTEVHVTVSGYGQVGEYSNRFFYHTSEEFVAASQLAILNYEVVYSTSTSATVRGMIQFPVRPPWGYPEGSHGYKIGGDQTFGALTAGGFASWLWPDVDGTFQTGGGMYPPGTIVNFAGTNYDLSGRQIEVPIVNYLVDPRWCVNDPEPDGTPRIGFVPYALYESVFTRNLNRPTLPNIIAGEHLVGIIREDRVRQALNRPVLPVPVWGYFSYCASDFNLEGNIAAQGWFEPDAYFGSFRKGANFFAAKLCRWFNERGVQHIYVDVRNSAGGIPAIQTAFVNAMGADRQQRYLGFGNAGNLERQQMFDDTGVSPSYDLASYRRNGENEGVYDYKYMTNDTFLQPQSQVSLGVFPAIESFGGAAPVDIPGLSTKRNIIWNFSETTTSGTQYAILAAKGASTTLSFDGDWGNNVQYVAWGGYDRHFSTGGGFVSFINWYGRNRLGLEQSKIPPVAFDVRYEGIRAHINISAEESPSGVGSIYAGDDVYFRFQQPNLLPNMTTDVFLRDIGYTLDGGVNALQGTPWLATATPGAQFNDALSYRDSMLERAIVMGSDPNLNTHFFKQDGYGDV